MRLRAWPLIACALLLPVPGPAADKKAGSEKKPEPPAEVRRPDWGKVIGWVVDASTKKPIPDARVSVEIDGAFPETGKSAAKTDARGRFEAKAPLGKVSSKLDWGRVLTMSPLSLLVSPKSVTKQTKIVDVMQVNARVEADGYRPFLGRVRARVLNPGAFSITLDDVWLAPNGSSLASFSPERRRMEVIESFTVEPAIAAPGDKVTVTLTAQLPVDRGEQYRAYLTSTARRLAPDDVEMKRQKAPKDQTRVVFQRQVTLPKKSLDRWSELSFYLVWDDAILLRPRETRALLQVVSTPEERAGAEKVTEGYSYVRAGDREAALRAYGQARKLNPGYSLPHLLYGDLCLLLNRPKDAAGAYKQLVELNPRDYHHGRSRYAQALFEAGDPALAMEQVAAAEDVLGKQRIPPDVFLVRARVLANQGNFEEADRWLAKAGEERQLPQTVLTEINLKRMVAAVQKDPENADLRLSYARVLEGARRQDEAIVQTRRAAQLDPGQPWAFIDLGSRLVEGGRAEEGVRNLKHALKLAPENIEAVMALADAHRKAGRYAEALPLYRKVVEEQELNLPARHYYALMLYAAGDLNAARVELHRVVEQARDKGDLRDSGIPFIGPGILGSGLYFGPKRRLVRGFSVPEAAADIAILEALQDLEKHPDNALLWQNIGSALMDLDMPDLALTALTRSYDFDPSLLETRFLLGVAYRKLGRLEPARAELKAVVAENPIHPRARLELAQLHTDLGELEQAQAQLLAHTRNYPHERPAAPTRSF
jgi:tetratricopeptide (TPR) repeat protein